MFLEQFFEAPDEQAMDTIFKVFGMTRPGLEPVTSQVWGGHFNHFTTTPLIARL